MLRVIAGTVAAVALAVTLGGAGAPGDTVIAGLSLLLGLAIARPWALLVPVVIVLVSVAVLAAHRSTGDGSEVISLIAVGVGVLLSRAFARLAGRHAR